MSARRPHPLDPPPLVARVLPGLDLGAPPLACPECGEDHAPHERPRPEPPVGPTFLAARARVFGRRETAFRRLLGGRR